MASDQVAGVCPVESMGGFFSGLVPNAGRDAASIQRFALIWSGGRGGRW